MSLSFQPSTTTIIGLLVIIINALAMLLIIALTILQIGESSHFEAVPIPYV
jgi:hypothetical protein